MTDKPKFSLGRRSFVGGVSALTSLTSLGALNHFAPRASAAPRTDGQLFALGVASGDPDTTSVTLWTRLMHERLNDATPAVVPVSYEVAEDERMRKVVCSGTAFALPGDGFSVHVRAEGLRPNRWYFYRFKALGEVSRVGRTRTFPRNRFEADKMRFALASCQDFQAGFYTAYRNMLNEDIDFVLHVGDYIYENGTSTGGPRQVTGGEIITLDDYRNRYITYRLDPALQDVHAAFPFIATWDDHEVDNNYAGDVPEDDQDPTAFLARRAAGYQAYFEFMPLPEAQRPSGSEARIFRRLSFGTLADILVLDTRQMRTDQPCGDGFAICPEVFDENATLLGRRQMRWLEKRLEASDAVWNVLAQQVMMTRWDLTALTGFQSPLFNVDAWDGYQVARDRLLSFIAERAIQNPVVLTGDIHSSWAADLRVDFSNLSSPIIATEFVGTSISSEFPVAAIPQVQATLPSNPHIRYFEGAHRGYLVCEVTPALWTTQYRGVDSVLTPESGISTLATFVTEAGRPGAQVG